VADGDTGDTVVEAVTDADIVAAAVCEGVTVGQTADRAALSDTLVPAGCATEYTVLTVLPLEHDHGPTDCMLDVAG
jgi:hypothetical protein